MEKSIQYAAHLPPVSLPIIKKYIPSEPQDSCEATAEVTQTSLQTFSVIESHQYYLQQQANLFEHLLYQQANLWQQYIQLAKPAQLTQSSPQFSRQDLEGLASGTISDYFGEWFKPLDQYARLIRMPEPPLLLADRVMKIAAIPGSLKKGTIWTETDVKEDAWYLHHGRMPAGIMIESGQADLLLASWLGFDLYNQGKRVYRLLGCELSYHGELPEPGDTLCYDIHIDGQAKQGDIRLFFFHYDCRINGELRLKVRHGQAGFFTDEELEESGGVLWEPAVENDILARQHAAPHLHCAQTTFTRKQLELFAEGRVRECFGDAYAATETHTRTPAISAGKMLFLHEITDFNVTGGPYQRGYIRALQHIQPDDWFFQGHFKNDPCMPGTLMLEAGLQLIAFYLTGLGYTVNKDGWRFEPVTEQTYKLRCRAQVRPTSKQVVYEVFISQVIAEPVPMIFGDLLGTVDGLKAFHTRIGVRLVPDWPLTASHPLLKNHVETKPVASVAGLNFDYASLLACAFGKPSHAFGEMYKRFDNHRRVARLPCPPYHFMTRITEVQGNIGELKIGAAVECEYDIPSDVWYFADNPANAMPFCVFLEAALQPCGWLGSYMGSALQANEDVFFRNLDGVGNLMQVILPRTGTLRTRVKCSNLSNAAGVSVQQFDVECFIGEQKIYSMQTVFGFFPLDALKNQVGLPVPETEKDLLKQPSDFFIDLTKRPVNYFTLPITLPTGQLLMIDRITGFWPTGGQKALGQLRAEKTVHYSDWFFKAHFFQDPVQPGSLGLEAMNQTLQFYMLHKNMHKNIHDPCFEPLALHMPMIWKFRGQVLPTNKIMQVTLDIMEEGSDDSGVYAIANGALWVDGKRIYEAKNLSLRITSKAKQKESVSHFVREHIHVDPQLAPWIQDHCPTYLIPTLPIMGALHYMTNSARKYFPNKKLVTINNIKMSRWMIMENSLDIFAKVNFKNRENIEISLATNLQEQEKIFANCALHFADNYPHQPRLPDELINKMNIQDPYFNLFHGKSLQIVQSIVQGSNGASSVIHIADLPKMDGLFHPILLDATMHSIPSDNLTRWTNEIGEDQVGYPSIISQMICYDQPPKVDTVTCEVRFAGFHQSKRFPQFDVTVIAKNKIWIAYRVIYALFSKGPLNKISPEHRRAFLQYKKFVPGIALSTVSADHSYLSIKTVKSNDWLPGSVAALFEVSGDWATMTKHILIKEHFAAILKEHPATITVHNENTASCKLYPEKIFTFKITENAEQFTLTR